MEKLTEPSLYRFTTSVMPHLKHMILCHIWSSKIVLEESNAHSYLENKSRLAPIKQIRIPRLELCAAVTAVQVNALLQKELKMKIDETFY